MYFALIAVLDTAKVQFLHFCISAEYIIMSIEQMKGEDDMFGVLFLFAFIGFMLFIGFTLTGAFLSALIWLCVKVPLAIICWAIGLALCCTIILIPIGVSMVKCGIKIMIPGRLI